MEQEGASVGAGHEEEIDLLDLAKRLWSGRRLIVRWCAVAAVAGLVIGFSIPKEYTTTAKLAPEAVDGKSGSGGLGALASMAGINLGSGGGSDAVYPELYPDVVASVPFAMELFDVEVATGDGSLRTTLYDYLSSHTRRAWWSAVAGAPFQFIGWLRGLFSSESEEPAPGRDPFRLTREEAAVAKALGSRITVSVDKKTTVITLSVTMQDPLIAATLADTVMNGLQRYVTGYRTNKARHDLEFTQQLYEESRASYYASQESYARYMDSNHNIVLRSMRADEERLRNEMMLAYNLYNQMAQQLQVARAKVQESTPVYAVVQPATVPLQAAKPSRVMILAACIFLAACAAAAWILFGRDFAAQFRRP